MKKNDIILIVVVLAIAAGLLFVVQKNKTQADSGYISVSVAGTETERYPLDKDGVYEIEAHDGDKNVLTVKDGEARMTEANCADQVCVYQSAISKNGDMIICLPHQLIISVVSKEEKTNDGVSN